eukprot:360591-Chlamydomonas_euryale.AAC.24
MCSWHAHSHALTASLAWPCSTPCQASRRAPQNPAHPRMPQAFSACAAWRGSPVSELRSHACSGDGVWPADDAPQLSVTRRATRQYSMDAKFPRSCAGRRREIAEPRALPCSTSDEPCPSQLLPARLKFNE